MVGLKSKTGSSVITHPLSAFHVIFKQLRHGLITKVTILVET